MEVINKPNNLETFRILFIIKGIVTLLFSVFPLFYIFLGATLFNGPEVEGLERNVGWIGNFMIIIGVFVFLLLAVGGILTIIAGKYIGNAEKYNFVLVVSILNCLTGILGILLGIFAIVEITKPHVKELFNRNKASF